MKSATIFYTYMIASSVFYYGFPALVIKSGNKIGFTVALIVASVLFVFKDQWYDKNEFTSLNIGMMVGGGVCFFLSTFFLDRSFGTNYVSPEFVQTISSIIFIVISYGFDLYLNGRKHWVEHVGCVIVLIGMIVMLIGQKYYKPY